MNYVILAVFCVMVFAVGYATATVFTWIYEEHKQNKETQYDKVIKAIDEFISIDKDEIIRLTNLNKTHKGICDVVNKNIGRIEECKTNIIRLNKLKEIIQ